MLKPIHFMERRVKLLAVNKITVASAGTAKRKGWSLGVKRMRNANASRTKVMIIAQVILITPIIASVAHQAIRELWAEYHDLLISLNATRFQRIKALLWDSRRALLTASLTGFGRAVGEVGAIMIVGGNIEHSTRVLTTAIALETGKGNFALALALGFVLIALALGVNYALHFLSRTERSSRW